MEQLTIDELRNELFTALYTVRKIEGTMFEFTRSSNLVSPRVLCPIRRQLENVRTALDKVYSTL